MARELPYIAAIGEAIHQEMERDETVLHFGQNIATHDDDPYLKAFGPDRVRVTPISETAEIGMAIGAAMAGYRPVVELYMAEFMLVAMDQVVNEANRFHYMSAGQVKVPIVLKAGYGFTAGWAGQHTGTIYGMFMGVPGLKVALPATPADAASAAITAAADPCRVDWSTTTSRPVFATDSRIVGRSSGASVRGSMTSALTPSAANWSAASSAFPSIHPSATIVTSLPSRTTFACPSGTTCSPSGTSPCSSVSR